MPTSSTLADTLMVRLAAHQHGVVARRQLLALGVSGRQVDLREQRGILRRQYRGVYAVGHEQLRPEGRRLAAVLACGAGAALSHRSAATHWRVRYYALARIEVTVPRGRNGRMAGIRIRRRRLADDDVTVHDGVPVTTVARTLFDLASDVRRTELAGAVDEAHRRGLYDQAAVDAQLGRGRNGTVAFRKMLAERHPERERARSTLETLGIDLFGVHGLPLPQINVWFPELGEPGARSICSGPTSASWSSWTAGTSIASGPSSRTTGARASSCSRWAMRCCASPGGRRQTSRSGWSPTSARNSRPDV